nr:MAG TPA: large terminase [Caudoviricetes sp.]
MGNNNEQYLEYLEDYRNRENIESTYSNDPLKEESIDFEVWTEFISYYRYYIDAFACDILGLRLFPFQRLILRAMARYQNSMLIACRGLGKSYIVAVFYICVAILYPNIKLGIASGNSQQARNVIIQKIKGELSKNEAIAREIKFPIKTGDGDCVVEFKNGSEIRAITLAQDRGGDSARSWRFSYILIDEARLVKDEIIEEILIPMTKTKRQNAIRWNQSEKGKVIFISSAYLKTSKLYSRFKFHYNEMTSGNKNYMAICFPYQVGVQAGLFDQDDIEKELEKPQMTKDKFAYEFEGRFVGSSGESYYPYELTNPCRVLERCEFQQPKKSNSIYVITHDVAVSTEKNSDNACTHVIKLKLKPNGTYTKQVVFTKTVNGISLNKQRDFLRELIHIKFPNTVKLLIDAQGAGAGLPSMFYESWEYTDPKTGVVTEYPPIISDDEKSVDILDNAIPLIRGVHGMNNFVNLYYPYMKGCFEDGSLELLMQSAEVDNLYKSNMMSFDEYYQHVEHDILQSELSNIKQDFTNNEKMTYTRIVSGKKRDRATSLMYGLSYVCELETDNKKNIYGKQEDYSSAPICVSTVDF